MMMVRSTPALITEYTEDRLTSLSSTSQQHSRRYVILDLRGFLSPAVLSNRNPQLTEGLATIPLFRVRVVYCRTHDSVMFADNYNACVINCVYGFVVLPCV